MNSFYRNFGKYIFDVALVLVSAPLWVPLLLIVALAVRIKIGKPVLFIQSRIGKDEKQIKIFKFRSMISARDKNGELLSDNQRIVPFGQFIRSSSLDELPGLFQVLTGTVSLVGPRPLLTDYLPLYNSTQQRRHEVRPGITGLAQINGRNDTTWAKRFEHDIEYIDSVSLWLDIKILFRTVSKVLQRSGINSSSENTMERFTGEK